MRGFTLVECVVALLLLAVAALGLAECLVAAQRAQVDSGRWMRAAALAEEGLERARLAGCGAEEALGAYARSCSSSGDAGARRIEVAVRWHAPAPRELRLATLVRE